VTRDLYSLGTNSSHHTKYTCLAKNTNAISESQELHRHKKLKFYLFLELASCLAWLVSKSFSMC